MIITYRIALARIEAARQILHDWDQQADRTEGLDAVVAVTRGALILAAAEIPREHPAADHLRVALHDCCCARRLLQERGPSSASAVLYLRAALPLLDQIETARTHAA